MQGWKKCVSLFIVMDESNDLITAFPSFGDYSK